MLHTDRTVTVIMNNGHKFTASRATGGNNQSLHNPNDLSDIVSVLAMPNGAFVCFNSSGEAFVVNGNALQGALYTDLRVVAYLPVWVRADIHTRIFHNLNGARRWCQHGEHQGRCTFATDRQYRGRLDGGDSVVRATKS